MEANLQATEWDRDTLIKARWLVGCQEAKAGKVHKSLIRQVWIPDEWLAEEEPENPPRHGKDSTKELRSSRGTGPQAPALSADKGDKGSKPTVSKAPGEVVEVQPPPAPTAKTAEGAGGSNSGPKDPKARVKAGDENELHGTKHSDGSTGISSPFDTSSNSSKESSPVDMAKDGCSGSSSRNVINISSCITSDRGKTISLDASITPKRHRVPTAEEEATAALSAMLGLGKPKAPQKPTPPPRTHVPWSSAESSHAPEKPRKGLNPNAAEFHPCMWSYDCEYEYDFVPPPPPPLEGEEAPEQPELPEMSNLLGVNLLDEICGGAAVPQAGQRMDDDEAA